jgi:preprotein translocase subunit SecE
MTLKKVIMLLKKIRFFQEISYVNRKIFWQSGRQLKDLLKTVIKIRRCHLKKFQITPLFQSNQKQQTDTINRKLFENASSPVFAFLFIIGVFPDFLDTLYIWQILQISDTLHHIKLIQMS